MHNFNIITSSSSYSFFLTEQLTTSVSRHWSKTFKNGVLDVVPDHVRYVQKYQKNPEVVDDVIVKYPFPVGQKNFDTP